jgi:hypothetical protein
MNGAEQDIRAYIGSLIVEAFGAKHKVIELERQLAEANARIAELEAHINAEAKFERVANQ